MKLKGLNHIFAYYDNPEDINRELVIEDRHCPQLGDIYLNTNKFFYDLEEMEIYNLVYRVQHNERCFTYDPTFTRYLYEIT